MGDTYKILGQSKPAATTSTDLYTVPAGTEAVVSSIVVTNQSATATSFRISLAVAGAVLGTTQYLHYDVNIDGNETYVATIGIALAATDVIRVYNTLATLSFNAFGIEVTPAADGWGDWVDVNGGPGFENSWVNYGSSNQDAEYRVHSDGMVHVRGLIKSGSFSVDAWQMPTGFRPPAANRQAVVSNQLFGWVEFQADGSVYMGAGSNTWFEFDNFYDSTGGT